VVLIDDHQFVRAGLADLINGERGLCVCGETGDASSALTLIEKTRPDLAIVDLGLGETGRGLELIRRLREIAPRVRILVFSMHDPALFAERTLDAGAMGYVSKQAPAGQILHAVREILAGRMHFCQPSARAATLRPSVCHDTDGLPVPHALADRELEVFELLGTDRSVREIADQLHISTRAVVSHCEQIRSMLGIASVNELVRVAVAWRCQRGSPEKL
jgi:DNA-binding NarL/FixJ family response regulator